MSSQASSASSSAVDSATSGNGGGQQQATSVAEESLSWLEVFVLGYGEESCKPEDNECLKRERQRQ